MNKIRRKQQKDFDRQRPTSPTSFQQQQQQQQVPIEHNPSIAKSPPLQQQDFVSPPSSSSTSPPIPAHPNTLPPSHSIANGASPNINIINLGKPVNLSKPVQKVPESPPFEDQLSDYKRLQRERYLKQKQEAVVKTFVQTSSVGNIHLSKLSGGNSHSGVLTPPLIKVKMNNHHYREVNFTSKDGCLWINDVNFKLKGINWFGCETETSVVHGLWSRDYKQYLDFLQANHFNAIRIPFCLEMILKDPIPTSISITTHMNSDLHGLRALSVLDIIIEAAGERGIFILLDLHSFGPNDRLHDGLWYNSAHTEQETLKAWNILILRYGRTWNVMGVDLKNEPYSATWDSGNPLTDWDKAINRIGSFIQTNGGNRWLIFGQGVPSQQSSSLPCCWGESFESEGRQSDTKPLTTIHLPIEDKFVYSPHCYGPSVVNHNHFRHSSFPDNMMPHWDANFGMLPQTTRRAVVIGEWGGKYAENLDRLWMTSFVKYLQNRGCTDSFYWCLNPNSGDTGGLLKDDWVSINQDKLDLLHKLCPHPTKVRYDKDLSQFIITSATQSHSEA
ncbi:hypothetical protein SAMD00019534_080210 [Acytostelium subglobosum LB1]|uniref:hypothetical protein n=1 Tax=Acytostelium subglobosum LB1 TaxID=1410327 RepID=UPI000644892F|nr:hypothetical protein SAMD00019534_080210 [Acytostelium subglobosum LB1]GAM24846.1 hypothetical protein SAMD00019534_080210 [Acytostelium subglobosum LB1]|eukprot:XP_012751935.1 hypothetical protein SAMD00019534_080210 [Acytostelium subglobosum LB1]